MPKKRILHIQLLPLLSGVQKMMLNLISGLDKNDYEIFVISKPGGPLEEAVINSGYNYLPVKSLRRDISPLDFIALIKIYFLIKKNRIDIVHTHSSKTGFIGRIAGRLAGAKKVYHTVHGFAIHEYQSSFTNKLYKFLEYFAGKFCDKVIFVNRFEREMAIKSKLLPENKTTTIYNGIDFRTFEVKDAEQYLNNRDYSLQPFTIGSVLRFTAQKNIINTIKAAIKVCKLNKSISFVFIGDGEDFRKCKQKIVETNLNTRILLTGWQSQINQLLVKMDIYMLYSRWEGLSISILEAMASGLPIIASNIKGNNELVDEKNGILVDINDPQQLIDILIKLPKEKNKLKSWSINSRKKVEKEFNIQKFVSQYKVLYDS